MRKKILVIAAGLAVVAGLVSAPIQAQAAPGGYVQPKVTAESLGWPAIPGRKAADKAVRPIKGDTKQKPPSAGKPGGVTTLSGSTRDYVQGYQAITTTGACANFSVGNPQLDGNNDYHTLAEIALTNGNDIVEIGWQKAGFYTPYDLTKVHLFTFSWVNGSGVGYGTNWVDVAATPVNLGDVMATSNVTTGASKQFCLQWDAASDAWWAGMGGQWIAYLPHSQWASIGHTFKSATMNQFFGEVALDLTRGYSCSDMGTGSLGSTGTLNQAAVIGSTAYVGQPVSAVNLTLNTPGVSLGEYDYYQASPRTFYFGGPGRNSAGTAIGTKGSC